jgi:hypothetical protein
METGNLADLAGEVERRLTGSSRRALPPDLADGLPQGETVVMVLFDGLGVAQLTHEAAAPFRDSQLGVLASSFPTTTSVALASMVTAQEPYEHGLIAHLMYHPGVDRVVNTLKWVDLTGNNVHWDYSTVLPRPNLWERLDTAGVEAITVQPGPFQGSPLSRLLYRGARFEPAWSEQDLVDATVELASVSGRLIFTYVPPVDVAGHVHGLESRQFSEAMQYAARVWDQLQSRLPPGAALIGTADHGLIEYPEDRKILVREPRFDSLRFAGDPRGVHVWGDPALISEFASRVGGEAVDPAGLFGGSRQPTMGDALVLAPSGTVVLPPGFDKRLLCYHGGFDAAEVEVPLLVG